MRSPLCDTEVRGDLDPLRLTARQRRRGLPEPEIAEPDLVEHLQAADDLRRAREERERLADGQVEHLIDVPALVAHLEHLRAEALAVALLAGHEHVGEELHLDADDAFAFAGLAAAAGHVEREVTGREAARARVLGRREELADRIERLEIRDRVRARRPADRLLIDEHGVADELDAFELAMAADAAVPVALRALDRRVDHVVDERRLTGSADARHAGEQAERNLDVDVLQVVLGRAGDAQTLRCPACAASAAPESPARRAGTSP